MSLGSKPYDAEIVKAAVQQLVPAVTQKPTVLVFNLQSLPCITNPGLRMHTGLHPLVANMIVQHHTFPSFCGVAIQQLDAIRNTTAREATLVFVSRRGCHRSVLAAKLFQEYVLVDKTMSLGWVHCEGNFAEDTTCGLCSKCTWWSRRWKLRNLSLSQALKMCTDSEYCLKCHNDRNPSAT